MGNKLESFENSEPFLPISKVILKVDRKNIYTAGDDSGRTIEKTMSWATQEMADSILTSLKGQVYKPFTGSGAFLDPAAELGDAITVAGNYGMLAGMSRQLDRMGISEISAPGADELDDEFPYTPKSQREVERVLAKSYSRISKTADQILLKVEDELDGLSASIDVQLDSITSQVSGIDRAVSEISQKVDNITLSVSNGTDSSMIQILVNGVAVSSETIKFTGDVVFESDLASGETVVSGDCITTGKIATDYLHLGGEMYIYSGYSTDITNYGGSFGYYQGWTYDENGNLQTTNGVGIRYSSSRGQLNCTSGGVWCGCGSVSGISAYPTGVTIKGNTIRFEGNVDGLSVDTVSGSYTTVQGSRNVSITSGGSVDITSGYDDVALSSSDGTIALRLDWANGRIKFWVDGTTWYLDADGLHR